MPLPYDSWERLQQTPRNRGNKKESEMDGGMELSDELVVRCDMDNIFLLNKFTLAKAIMSRRLFPGDNWSTSATESQQNILLKHFNCI